MIQSHGPDSGLLPQVLWPPRTSKVSCSPGTGLTGFCLLAALGEAPPQGGASAEPHARLFPTPPGPAPTVLSGLRSARTGGELCALPGTRLHGASTPQQQGCDFSCCGRRHGLLLKLVKRPPPRNGPDPHSGRRVLAGSMGCRKSGWAPLGPVCCAGCSNSKLALDPVVWGTSGQHRGAKQTWSRGRKTC
jgi:hypothetical protein